MQGKRHDRVVEMRLCFFLEKLAIIKCRLSLPENVARQPNMEKTFGNLEYAGESEVVQRRINGRMTAVSRSYNLYSDVQRADDIIVVLPAEAGEKHFQPEQKVKLINPRITAEGYKIGTRGFTNYILLADDMLPAENK